MTADIGRRVSFRRTVTEGLVDLYCGVTEDFDPLHVDEQFSATTPYGRRIAPGGLIIGFMLAASSQATRGMDVAVASVGFNRIRHPAPVFFGDTVEVVYEITKREGNRGYADVKVTNQDGVTVAAGEHVLAVLD